MGFAGISLSWLLPPAAAFEVCRSGAKGAGSSGG